MRTQDAFIKNFLVTVCVTVIFLLFVWAVYATLKPKVEQLMEKISIPTIKSEAP